MHGSRELIVAGIWGMNVKVPGMIGFEDTPPGYNWFIGILTFMLLFGISVASYFRKKGWL